MRFLFCKEFSFSRTHFSKERRQKASLNPPERDSIPSLFGEFLLNNFVGVSNLSMKQGGEREAAV